MRKIFTFTLFIVLLSNIVNTTTTSASSITSLLKNTNIYNATMKQDILCLMIAYPEYITNIEENNGYVYLVMKSGRKLLYDDKKYKTPQDKLSNPDLQDTLEQIYPLVPIRKIMETDFDPGRVRSYGLLHEIYGSSKQAIESKLTNINVGYSNYRFNSNNKAAYSLQTAIKEILPLSQRNQNVKKCFLPCSGTFNYRVISGTNRLSPHSFGIAIDLASDKRDYWKWASKEDGQKRLASYPNELVEVFERNGFVWGGKWSHFDILHFEYRPEIILKARYFSGNMQLKDQWYAGAPIEQSPIKDAIQKINELIKQ